MGESAGGPTTFPVRIPQYILALLETDPDHGFRKQVVPSGYEQQIEPYELTDPLGEDTFSPVPRLIHRYRNRALLLTTDACALHCRFCFRRSSFTGKRYGAATDAELDAVCDYLASHTEIGQLLLSGGDPLMLSDRELETMIEKVRSARDEIVLRLCTRIPVALPGRVTGPLCSMLRRFVPVWAVIHCNHPDELTPDAGGAIAKLVDRGIPVVSQTVLLAGVNDSADVLARLFEELLALRVKPYQLFQLDLVPGTSHFRVPVERGLEIVGEVKKRISGLAMPAYSVDLPGGGGKIRLDSSVLDKRVGNWYELESPHDEPDRYNRRCTRGRGGAGDRSGAEKRGRAGRRSGAESEDRSGKTVYRYPADRPRAGPRQSRDGDGR